MTVKRKLGGTALICCALVCLAGASSISYDAGQPAPNAGGKLSYIQGKGTYEKAQDEMLLGISHNVYETKTEQASAVAATAKDGKWEGNLNVVAGNYNCQARMQLMDKDKNFITRYSKTINIDVK